jgi:hypothetical protein
MDKKHIIYQFCQKNYQSVFEMLNRIFYTIRDYKREIQELEEHSLSLDIFSGNSSLTLIDIIPPFLMPNIHEFDFDEFEDEEKMMDSIYLVTNDFLSKNSDPNVTLVIQLIHTVSG